MITCLILLLLFPQPTSSDSSRRNDHLLSIIQSYTTFEFLEQHISPSLEVSFEDHSKSTVNKCSQTKKSPTPTKTPPPTTSPPSSFISVEQNIDFLASTCREINLGWWQYRWCHAETVVQYHVERDGSTTASQSLGQFNALATQDYQEKQRQSQPQNGPSLVQIFDNGNECDDNEFRSTRVEFYCCTPSSIEKDKTNIAAITSINEPKICQYTLKICTIHACVDDQKPSSKISNVKSKSSSSTSTKGTSTNEQSIFSLLAPLEHSCFRLQDGWWMYELCLNVHVRQYHLQEASNTKNAKKEKTADGNTHEIVQVHMLGKAKDPKGKIGKTGKTGKKNANSKKNKKGTSSGEGVSDEMSGSFVREGDLMAFETIYTNGEKCAITGAARETAVRFVCVGLDVTTSRLIRVEETETCRYTAVFHTPYLCRHPRFSKAVERTVEVECVLSKV